ncbi:MAG: hypothetical protein JWR87_3734, partial [Segetibacter sp.]|nr:hypothetical protein [Segetibacter sp.]
KISHPYLRLNRSNKQHNKTQAGIIQ